MLNAITQKNDWPAANRFFVAGVGIEPTTSGL